MMMKEHTGIKAENTMKLLEVTEELKFKRSIAYIWFFATFNSQIIKLSSAF